MAHNSTHLDARWPGVLFVDIARGRIAISRREILFSRAIYHAERKHSAIRVGLEELGIN